MAIQANEVTRVTYRWDAQAGVEPGWYAEAWAGDSLVYDSQKVWFPVDVDEFGEDDCQKLGTALQEAFPSAEIG